MRYFSLPAEGVAAVLKQLLEAGDVDALLVPVSDPKGRIARPVLVADPARLGRLDLWTPVSMVNAAGLLAEIAGHGAKDTVLAVLRPCEARALVELAKLRQVQLDQVVVMGLDCLGSVPAACWPQDQTEADCLQALAEGEVHPALSEHARPLCLSCVDLESPYADLRLVALGSGAGPLLAAEGDWADKLAQHGLEEVEAPAARADLLEQIRADRGQLRRQVVDEARGQVAPLELFASRFATCLRCGNCREMCPICYCRQCVFDTPDFVHEPGLYVKWARRHGLMDVPAEVGLFHMTRLNHMALSCVGCGHCSSACPQDLPVSELFYALGEMARELFDYEPGRAVDEQHPFQTFEEDELEPR